MVINMIWGILFVNIVLTVFLLLKLNQLIKKLTEIHYKINQKFQMVDKRVSLIENILEYEDKK